MSVSHRIESWQAIEFRLDGLTISTGTRARRMSRVRKETIMHMLTSAGPLASLIAGILILVVPRLLNYIVAIYLIVIGLLGLFGSHLR
jgi:Protein of unknown function (DUF3096)